MTTLIEMQCYGGPDDGRFVTLTAGNIQHFVTVLGRVHVYTRFGNPNRLCYMGLRIAE